MKSAPYPIPFYSMTGDLELPVQASYLLDLIEMKAKARGWNTEVKFDRKKGVFVIRQTTWKGLPVQRLFHFAVKAFKTYGGKPSSRLSYRGFTNYASFRFHRIPEEELAWVLNEMISCGAVAVIKGRDNRSGKPLDRYELVSPEKMS